MTGDTHVPLTPLPSLDPATQRALAEGTLGDPFAVLGPHESARGRIIRAFLPGAVRVEAVSRLDGHLLGDLAPGAPYGLFEGTVTGGPYFLRIHWPGAVQETEDPYAFGLLVGDLDLHLFAEGRHLNLARCLGAQMMVVDGVAGVRFSVWAPNARSVAVVGDFNTWDPRRHPMRLRHQAGIWELFVPRVMAAARYKFAIVGRDGHRLPFKADPVALATEKPPATASVVAAKIAYRWHDDRWMAERGQRHAPDMPISIYEVHAGSWLRPEGAGDPLFDWDALAERLVPYVEAMGFTHIELMPIAEHPFSGSWGYQPLGLFAPTARFGSREAFKRFVDACHAAELGVILDWVPAHFPGDAHGLARFDGTALYEHEDPREGFHRDWNTYIYNFGRREVQGFLVASALYWIEEFHIDGLRVDAVASMLYRDYSRAAGEWLPNIHGGRENLEAVTFLQRLNAVIAERAPGVVTIAEESTAWPGVTRPSAEDGLGFSYKWNMGWMHDTLRYVARDPVYRRHHHDDLTFGLVYAFSERFALPISHDEVVHGKGSLLTKMWGDDWQRRAGLRAYLAFMWTHPGKKLLFMGCEIAQRHEWNHDAQIDWNLLDNPAHRGIQRLVRDLNRLYRSEPALHVHDADPTGFRWVIGDDRANSVFAYIRLGHEGTVPALVVINMTPVPRYGYRIGVPSGGVWRERVNTDASAYGGSNLGNGGAVHASPERSHGEAQSIELLLPPLATLILQQGA